MGWSSLVDLHRIAPAEVAGRVGRPMLSHELPWGSQSTMHRKSGDCKAYCSLFRALQVESLCPVLRRRETYKGEFRRMSDPHGKLTHHPSDRTSSRLAKPNLCTNSRFLPIRNPLHILILLPTTSLSERKLRSMDPADFNKKVWEATIAAQFELAGMRGFDPKTQAFLIPSGSVQNGSRA
jgi:hypothetical protein